MKKQTVRIAVSTVVAAGTMAVPTMAHAAPSEQPGTQVSTTAQPGTETKEAKPSESNSKDSDTASDSKTGKSKTDSTAQPGTETKQENNTAQAGKGASKSTAQPGTETATSEAKEQPAEKTAEKNSNPASPNASAGGTQPGTETKQENNTAQADVQANPSQTATTGNGTIDEPKTHSEGQTQSPQVEEPIVSESTDTDSQREASGEGDIANDLTDVLETSEESDDTSDSHTEEEASPETSEPKDGKSHEAPAPHETATEPTPESEEQNEAPIEVADQAATDSYVAASSPNGTDAELITSYNGSETVTHVEGTVAGKAVDTPEIATRADETGLRVRAGNASLISYDTPADLREPLARYNQSAERIATAVSGQVPDHGATRVGDVIVTWGTKPADTATN